MPQAIEQIIIRGEMRASAKETKASFENEEIKLTATTKKPLLLIFSASYSWEEELDEKLNDWEFFMEITDEGGNVIHSEYKHFGEDEPGFVGKDESAYKDYIKEESYLKHYKSSDSLKKGDGTIVRSIKTSTTKGKFTFTCHISALFWTRKLGEDKFLVKNKTQSTAECRVIVSVK
jgi:hypothetical protein